LPQNDGDFPGKLVTVDLAKRDETAATLQELALHYAFDGVVNNVGLVRPQLLGEIALADLDEVLAVNLHSAVQAALPAMRDKSWSRIVNTSSLTILGMIQRTAYAAAKAALVRPSGDATVARRGGRGAAPLSAGIRAVSAARRQRCGAGLAFHLQGRPGADHALQLQRDGRWFVEPDRFNPERFLTEPAWPRGAYLPFGIGPRVCIGQNFDLMEACLVMATILHGGTRSTWPEKSSLIRSSRSTRGADCR
jgi:NAD(P)-dependent dehydrogenase (short-subunit alcohol dehydrogenase family)